MDEMVDVLQGGDILGCDDAEANGNLQIIHDPLQLIGLDT
jgi:hypothetical protein